MITEAEAEKKTKALQDDLLVMLQRATASGDGVTGDIAVNALLGTALLVSYIAGSTPENMAACLRTLAVNVASIFSRLSDNLPVASPDMSDDATWVVN